MQTPAKYRNENKKHFTAPIDGAVVSQWAMLVVTTTTSHSTIVQVYQPDGIGRKIDNLEKILLLSVSYC